MTKLRNSPGAPKKVERALRTKTALELRMQGLTLQQIADSLGLKAKSDAHKLVHEGLREAAEERKALGNHLIDLELARYDRLEASLAGAVDNGEVSAVRAALEISKERRALLGLDKPQRHEHVAAFTQLEPDALLALFDATATLPNVPSGPEGEAPGEAEEPRPE